MKECDILGGQNIIYSDKS